MSREKPRYITFDGLDATGKTTLTEMLKLKLGAVILRSPPDWKKQQSYKNYMSTAAKADLTAYLSRTELSLFDYFYQMRLKANYRDTDFLDFNIISSSDGVKFIDRLTAATDKYCNALVVAINDELAVRGVSL
jgi:hypothetical protein